MTKDSKTATSRSNSITGSKKKHGEIEAKSNTLRYGKALDRRSKINKKIALSLTSGEGDDIVEKKIKHLKQAMEDVSLVAQLEGYKHEQLMFVDEVLKHLGNFLLFILQSIFFNVYYCTKKR